MSFHYSSSYLSEAYPDIDMSGRSLGSFLRETGQDRDRIVQFCRSFRITGDCILFDGTDVFSRSEQMELPKFSKSKFGTYDDMITLMCIFSVKRHAYGTIAIIHNTGKPSHETYSDYKTRRQVENLSYLILKLLKKHELNHIYSPSDFLSFLSEVKKVKLMKYGKMRQ